MLNKEAEGIFKRKYAITEEETWEQACTRVATYVASIEDNEVEWIAKFYQIISDLVFIPGGRIIANSGTGIKNLMNCFVIPIEDSRKGIYNSLTQAAEVFAWGGGVGYNFSNLREEGSIIKTTGGSSSGSLSFMTLYDHTGEVIKQASRRGAQMGMLHISHPDIIKFIRHKSELNKKNTRVVKEIEKYLNKKDDETLDIVKKVLLDNQLTHFNVSVIVTDDFMQKVLEDGEWDLISPHTHEVIETVKAKDLLREIAEKAWKSGDPGIFFIDRAEEDNMVPYVNKIDATNPCGEVPLLPFESCCLGSLNLTKFYDEYDNKIDWEFLEYAIRVGIRFLDNVQTLSQPPIEKIRDVSEGLRKLGLGVMGWSDLLVMLGIPYDSEEALNLAEKLSWFITYFSWSESMRLAEERGTFRLFDSEKVNQDVIKKVLKSEHSFMEKETKEKIDAEVFKVRNTSVTTIAPTGTIALLAGVNSSIEPFYALAYERNITDGIGNISLSRMLVYNPLLKQKLQELELSPEELKEIDKIILETGSIQSVEYIPQEVKDLFKTAHEIPWQTHVKMQSAWQSFVTNAVSKTINMSNDATIDDIYYAYIDMWKKDLKGGTIYRDGSKFFQILNKVK